MVYKTGNTIFIEKDGVVFNVSAMLGDQTADLIMRCEEREVGAGIRAFEELFPKNWVRIK